MKEKSKSLIKWAELLSQISFYFVNKKLREDKTTIEIDSDKYLITGVPFYNNENENEFKETLENTLNEANA